MKEISIKQFYKSLGLRIRKLRKEKGLTQSQLGEKIQNTKTPKSIISKIEVGDPSVSNKRIIKVIEQLDANPVYVFSGVNSENSDFIEKFDQLKPEYQNHIRLVVDDLLKIQEQEDN